MPRVALPSPANARFLDTAIIESNPRGPLAAACGKPHNGEGHDPRVTDEMADPAPYDEAYPTLQEPMRGAKLLDGQRLINHLLPAMTAPMRTTASLSGFKSFWHVSQRMVG